MTEDRLGLGRAARGRPSPCPSCGLLVDAGYRTCANCGSAVAGGSSRGLGSLRTTTARPPAVVVAVVAIPLLAVVALGLAKDPVPTLGFVGVLVAVALAFAYVRHWIDTTS